MKAKRILAKRLTASLGHRAIGCTAPRRAAGGKLGLRKRLQWAGAVGLEKFYRKQVDRVLGITPKPITFKPAPSFQPPETCPDCKAGVPFGPDGHHLNRPARI